MKASKASFIAGSVMALVLAAGLTSCENDNINPNDYVSPGHNDADFSLEPRHHADVIF